MPSLAGADGATDHVVTCVGTQRTSSLPTIRNRTLLKSIRIVQTNYSIEATIVLFVLSKHNCNVYFVGMHSFLSIVTPHPNTTFTPW